MKLHQEYIRSIMFGVEDSLVSTTGLLAGITITAQNNRLIIVTATIAILIEAVSMGVSEYLSDDAVKDLDKIHRYHDSAFLSGLYLMIAYILSGFLVLAPIALMSFPVNLGLSVILALVGLYLLGYLKGRILHTPANKGGLKILVVGGITTLLGLVLGLVFKV